ncbi:coronatine-insensitive protein 1 [Magnolia sinica]|uniref:coronatine-insensitive protein 1 n=1 Tax=Magnolia sinica TaxID=86752 RepID=UPI00265AE727|nr:coronatine-insensitive protein 1 [Magnolia sinica]
MENRSFSRAMSFGISDVALDCVMAYIDDPRDRDAVSLVCRKWYNIDALTRKHITIALCYTTTPARLRTRFPRLESLKLKGKPRAAMFNLIPEDWGGYVGPWINEISGAFNCLKSLHFRRMIVRDLDLGVLVRSRGHMLQALRLDKCSGFSTDGLLQVTRSCRCLRTLFLEESSIVEKDGNWLHELAVNNTVLETLNFYMTELKFIDIRDLELIARNCRSLLSLKISDYEILELAGFFRAALSLEEFGGGSFNEQAGDIDKYSSVSFPPRLCRVGLNYMGKNEMPILFPCATLLKKLDLQYTFLDTEDHCQLIQRCPNLEILEVRNVIGDSGLEVLAQNCKKLRRLRIERGEDEQGMEDEQGVVSQRGLATLAQGCPDLEYLAVYVSDITNAALESIGTFSKNLTDFRLVLLDKEETITELPLDNGVRALLMGCQKLRRFALYLREGGLSDVGLGYIGKYSNNIRWMLLGFVGDSDMGLLEFSKGCPSLQKLEMRGCCFSERALAIAVLQLRSLRYIWVQGYKASKTGRDLLAMIRPYWNIEFIPPRQTIAYDEFGIPEEVGGVEQPAQILAYYSLAGRRADYPETLCGPVEFGSKPLSLTEKTNSFPVAPAEIIDFMIFKDETLISD